MIDDVMNAGAVWADLRCRDLEEALYFRSVLEAAGIEAAVPDEHTRGLPLAAGEAEAVRVLVRTPDLEKALAVLAAHPTPLD